MIEQAALASVEENSRWQAELGPGVELTVELDDGRELYVVLTALEDVDEEIATWRDERVGQSIEEVTEVVSLPLETGGRQRTFEVTLEDGYTFEGDLIEEAERIDTDEKSLETEWTFEGTPGVEMGRQETEGPER